MIKNLDKVLKVACNKTKSEAERIEKLNKEKEELWLKEERF